ncbi:MAG: hypothetical protein M3R08_10525 [Bacteroidota bacterium]|nr:hypothetical protein [Bacteroidota bacterium]
MIGSWAVIERLDAKNNRIEQIFMSDRFESVEHRTIKLDKSDDRVLNIRTLSLESQPRGNWKWKTPPSFQSGVNFSVARSICSGK